MVRDRTATCRRMFPATRNVNGHLHDRLRLALSCLHQPTAVRQRLPVRMHYSTSHARLAVLRKVFCQPVRLSVFLLKNGHRKFNLMYTERQSARMSNIANDCLIRSGIGCFIAVPIWQQWASKG